MQGFLPAFLRVLHEPKIKAELQLKKETPSQERNMKKNAFL